MKKWNLIIDVAKCFGCQACAIACHDEYNGNEFPGYAAEMPNARAAAGSTSGSARRGSSRWWRSPTCR